jgi:hypothetical protein
MFAPFAPAGNIGGGWGLQFFAPSAAGLSLEGRILTFERGPIQGAHVTVDGFGLTEPLSVTTGAFGKYRFEGLPAGGSYFVTVTAPRDRFAIPGRIISLPDNVSNFDFVADPEE